MKNLVFICGLSLIMLVNITVVIAGDHDQSNIYEVKSGDTLPEIAKKYDTSIEEMKAVNGLQSNVLIAGQKIRIPILYEVNVGGTLRKIASTYNSSVETIKTTNELSSEQLFPGQLLKITPKKMTMKDQHILMTKDEFMEWLLNHKFNRKISLIQQHHTWAPSYKRFNGSNHFQLLKGMEKFHTTEMGWSQIAQNITTFPDGKIAVSRPFDIAPEGSIGEKANTKGIAIENIGNFDIGHDVMTEEQKETIVYVTALLSIKFGLKPSIDSITYHHWWNLKTGERVLDNAASYDVKTCPGTGFFGGNSTNSAKKYFYPLVERKMEEIKAKME